MTERGKYIVLEGGDNVGKTTQALKLADNITGICVREPGGTAAGERIRSLLLDPAIYTVARAEVLLHAAQRAELMAEVVEPALENGLHVVSDRSWVSSAAYQGAQGINLTDIIEINKFAVEKRLSADLLVVLDASYNEISNRSNSLPDYYEQMAAEFHHKVRHNYLFLAKRLGGVVIDATASIEQVTQELRKLVNERLGI